MDETMTLTDGADVPVSQLLDQGRLSDAVTAATTCVKRKPMSAPDRILLADLLVLEGAIERADAHLKLAGDQAPAEAMAIAQSRQLLRAAEARRAWYQDNAVPEMLAEPGDLQRDVMRLALAVREADAGEAARLREALEERPPMIAACDAGAPAPLRDVCDLSQHGFEALTADGRYLWLAPHQLAEIRFSPARRPRDLIWRRADVLLRDGRNAAFFIVAQYWDEEAGETHRLARATDWIETPGGGMRGRGQRMLLCGDDAVNLMDIGRIVFSEAPCEAP